MFPPRITALSFAAFAWLLSFASAQSTSSTVKFVYPPKPTGTTQQLIINVIDTVVVQWDSNFPESFLWLYCDFGEPDNIIRWYNASVPASGNHSYSPFVDSDVSRSGKWNRPYYCHFDLVWDEAKSSGFNGPAMNVTSVPGVKATTWALEYTTTALPPSGSPSINTLSDISSMPTSTSTGTPPPESGSSGLSTGATAGVAIGVVAGVGALAILGFLAWRNKRRMKNLESRLPDDSINTYAKPQGVDVAMPYRDQELHQYNRQSYVPNTDLPAELEPQGYQAAHQPPSELPGSPETRPR